MWSLYLVPHHSSKNHSVIPWSLYSFSWLTSFLTQCRALILSIFIKWTIFLHYWTIVVWTLQNFGFDGKLVVNYACSMAWGWLLATSLGCICRIFHRIGTYVIAILVFFWRVARNSIKCLNGFYLFIYLFQFSSQELA